MDQNDTDSVVPLRGKFVGTRVLTFRASARKVAGTLQTLQLAQIGQSRPS
jgi:hypothetical protein